MADNRLLLKFDELEIVIAVRHGDQWRSARDERNDIGEFLNANNEISGFLSNIRLEYEHEREFCDPEIK